MNNQIENQKQNFQNSNKYCQNFHMLSPFGYHIFVGNIDVNMTFHFNLNDLENQIHYINKSNNNNNNNNNNLKKILISVRNYCDLGFFISHSLVLVMRIRKI